MIPANQLKNPSGGSTRILKTAAKGSAIALIGGFLGKILSLCWQLIVSWTFGPKFFGFYVTGVITCRIFQIPAGLGLQKGCMRFMAVAFEKKDYAAMPSIYGLAVIVPLLLGLAMAGLITWLSPYIAGSFFDEAELVEVLPVFIMAIPFWALLRILSELSRSFQTTKYSVMVEDFILVLCQIGFFFLFKSFLPGFSAVAYAFFAATVVSALIIILIVRRQLKSVMARSGFHLSLNNLVSGSSWREIIIYSLPFIPIALSLIGHNYLDIIMLNIFVDSEMVGKYAAAARLGIMFSTLLQSTNVIFGPLIAGQFGLGNHASIAKLYQTITRWLFGICLPLFVFVLLANQEIMMIFGQEFVQTASTVLVVLVLGEVVSCITGGVGLLLTMSGNQNKELITVVGSMALNIGLNIWLIPKYGIVGAAWATATSKIVANLVRTIIVYKIFKIQPFTRKSLAPTFTISIIYLMYLASGVSSSLSVGSSLMTATLAAVIVSASVLFLGLAKEDYAIIADVRALIRKKRGPRGR